jgi:hypothetical protein
MSKNRPDEKYSPLLWLIPLPFIAASFVPLTIDHPAPAKPQRVAAATHQRAPAASEPAVSSSHADPYLDR